MQHRRQLVVQRHDLAGGAASPRHVVRDVLALHATDPASVYLSVLARSAATAIDDVADAMYRRQVLVRWMAMRRTLFVLDNRDVPLVQAAVGAAVGESLRRSLVARVERCGTEPPITGDVASWLARLEAEVETMVAQRGGATGAELAVAVPALRTRITARAPSDRPETLTTSLLTEMAASARLVRGNPRGAWTSRTHDWRPVGARWPHGIPHPDPDDARRELACRWLERFGPATAEDLQWWTGWGKARPPPGALSPGYGSNPSTCTGWPGSTSSIARSSPP